MIGVVKFFNADRGYGFITPVDGGKDVFLHAGVLGRIGISVKEGDRLSFDTQPDKHGRGLQAVDVKRE
jgi:CspA family cold shock protein